MNLQFIERIEVNDFLKIGDYYCMSGVEIWRGKKVNLRFTPTHPVFESDVVLLENNLISFQHFNSLDHAGRHAVAGITENQQLDPEGERATGGIENGVLVEIPVRETVTVS